MNSINESYFMFMRSSCYHIIELSTLLSMFWVIWVYNIKTCSIYYQTTGQQSYITSVYFCRYVTCIGDAYGSALLLHMLISTVTLTLLAYQATKVQVMLLSVWTDSNSRVITSVGVNQTPNFLNSTIFNCCSI